MNGAWVHLGSVHLPIALAVISVLLVLFALVTKSPARLKFALEMIVIGAVLSWPAFLSGEKAEHVVEDFRGNVRERLILEDVDLRAVIRDHEQWAEKAHYCFQAAGVVALLGWLFCRNAEKFRLPLAIVALLFTGGTAGLMGWTGHLGGQIRHLEIREAAAGASTTSQADPPNAGAPREREGEDER